MRTESDRDLPDVDGGLLGLTGYCYCVSLEGPLADRGGVLPGSGLSEGSSPDVGRWRPEESGGLWK